MMRGWCKGGPSRPTSSMGTSSEPSAGDAEQVASQAAQVWHTRVRRSYEIDAVCARTLVAGGTVLTPRVQAAIAPHILSDRAGSSELDRLLVLSLRDVLNHLTVGADDSRASMREPHDPARETGSTSPRPGGRTWSVVNSGPTSTKLPAPSSRDLGQHIQEHGLRREQESQQHEPHGHPDQDAPDRPQ